MRNARLVGIIAKLKWLLLKRHFQRHLTNAIGIALAWLMLAVGALAGGAYLWLYCHTQGALARDGALYAGAWIFALLWLSAPFLQVDAQRNLDLNGLRLFPLSASAFTSALLVDALLTPLSLFAIPLLLAGLICFSLSWSELPFTMLALGLLVIFLLGLGQAFYLWANRLLSSRRFTDASLVLSLVLLAFWLGVNLLLQFNIQQAALPPWLSALGHALGELFAPLLDWLAPGLAARAVAQVSAGAWDLAALSYALLALQCIAATWLAGYAARQFYEGELESGGSVKERARVRPAQRNGGYAHPGLLASAVGALFHRERVFLARDPVMKALFVQTLIGAVYMLALILIMQFNAGEQASVIAREFRKYMLLVLAVGLSYAESGVLFNKFGYEGALFTNVLLSPVDRLAVLRAKSAFLLSHFALVNVALIGCLGLLLRLPAEYTIAAVLLVAANTVVVDCAGHFVSVYFPFTYRRQGRRMRMVMAQPGCGYALLYMLVFQLCNAAVLPGSAALGIGVVLGGWSGLGLGALAALGIAAAAHYFGLPYAARLLAQREPELLETLCKSAG